MCLNCVLLLPLCTDFYSPGHYVTPYDGGSSQIITQPISSTQQVAVSCTSAYDISQAQAMYTQQLAANHRSQVNKLAAASTARACPEIVSYLSNGSLL